MADHFGSLVAVGSFVLLIGGALLANALVDLGARPVRRWAAARRADSTSAGVARRPGPGD